MQIWDEHPHTMKCHLKVNQLEFKWDYTVFYKISNQYFKAIFRNKNNHLKEGLERDIIVHLCHFSNSQTSSASAFNFILCASEYLNTEYRIQN